MEHIRSSIVAISLGFLLTLFGHDVLMAADPHPAGTAGQGEHHDSPAPPDDIECGPINGMHLKPPYLLDVDDAALAHSLPRTTGERTGFLPHWSVVPGHPPDIRRALLQVYLN